MKKPTGFGQILKNLRIKNELGLRQACKLTGYDPSNWSKIERGLLAPPSEEKTLKEWAKILGLKKEGKQYKEFIYQANIAQGIIPSSILSNKNAVACLPAFFRTVGNKKPTKEEIDQLIKLIKQA